MSKLLKKKLNMGATNILLILATLAIMTALIVQPQRYLRSTAEGLLVFGTNVFPALFPFFFLTKLLTELGMQNMLLSIAEKPTKVLYNAPPISGYILLMSLVSGYPVGAKMVADAYTNGLIDYEDARRTITFTSMSGPLFIIGTVGTSILANPSYGYIILAAHILGGLINGLLYRGKKYEKSASPTKFRPPIQENSINNVIVDSIKNILIVGGYIVIFYMIADILTDVGIIKMLAKLLYYPLNLVGINEDISTGICLSLVEMTKGIIHISHFRQDMAIIPIISGIISLGGLSITMQSITFLAPTKIKVSFYLKQKLTHAILSTLIATIIVLIIA